MAKSTTTKIDYATLSSGYAKVQNKADVDERRWVHEKLEEAFETQYKTLMQNSNNSDDATEETLKLAIDYEMSMHELRKQFDQPKPQAPKPHRSQTHQSVSLAAKPQNPLKPQTQNQPQTAAPKLLANTTVDDGKEADFKFDVDVSNWTGDWEGLKFVSVSNDTIKFKNETGTPKTVKKDTELQ